jgi:hypothetical protein
MKKCVLTALATGLCCVATTFGQVPSYVPTSGLVGWWPFNGNANDESGNGNNGTVNGATLTTDRYGNANKAFYFSSAGCGTRIDADVNTNTIQNAYTFSYWFIQTGQGCVGPRTFEFSTGENASGFLQCQNWNTAQNVAIIAGTAPYSVLTCPTPLANEWSNITLTVNLNGAKLYYNGLISDSVSFSTDFLSLNGDMCMGRMNHPSYDAHEGKLDDIGIWNRALSDQEISNLYAGTTPVSCLPSYVPTNGLVGYWPFCGNADDESGNANHGTVNGATLTADRFGVANKAYSFDGVDDIITFSSELTNYSISMWFNYGTLTNQFSELHYYEDGSSSIVQSGSYIYVRKQNQIISSVDLSTSVINPGIWYHLVLIFDQNLNTITSVINSSDFIYSSDASGGLPNNFNDNLLNIGGRQFNNTNYFNGKIDDIGIWNRALTPCEVADLYNAQVGSANTSSTETIGTCGSYTWNGNTYTQSGQYTFLTTNAHGCDSTATLNLTINQPTTSSTSHAACSSYSWNGTTYTQSGQYNFQTNNAQGCDSTATLNLTINQPTTSSTSHAACSSYSWNGTTYTQSGQYTFLTTNANGCDSNATLNLTINQPTSSSTSQTECGSFSWNGTTYTQSGQYTFQTTNVNGCDSTATLNLTINQHTSATQTQSAIDNYTWPVNGQTYSQSGSYNAVIPNSVGCDSTITLNLTMNYTGLSDLKTNAIKLYPNPAKDFVTIELTNELIGKQYLIFNELGQVMQTGRITSNKVIIPIDKMVTGSYSLHIERCETIYFNVMTD